MDVRFNERMADEAIAKVVVVTPVNQRTLKLAKKIKRELKRLKLGEWSSAFQADGSIRLYSGDEKHVQSVTVAAL